MIRLAMLANSTAITTVALAASVFTVVVVLATGPLKLVAQLVVKPNEPLKLATVAAAVAVAKPFGTKQGLGSAVVVELAVTADCFIVKDVTFITVPIAIATAIVVTQSCSFALDSSFDSRFKLILKNFQFDLSMVHLVTNWG